jgi:hypothetical protein
MEKEESERERDTREERGLGQRQGGKTRKEEERKMNK